MQTFPVATKYDEVKKKWTKVPRIPKGENWQTYKASPEQFAKAKNLGVVIPEGCVVIDLDTYKGASREVVEKGLGCSLEWDDALLQRTLSDGQHYCFVLPDGVVISQGTNVAGITGLDTRCAGKGWICTGEGYADHTIFGVVESLRDGDFPMLPKEAIDALNGSYVVEGGIVDDFDFSLDQALAEQPLDGITLEDAKLYVDKLPKGDLEDHDHWLKPGFALHHQFKGSDEALNIWIEWSSGSTHFDEHECRDRWFTFAKRDGINKPTRFDYIIFRAGGKIAITDEKTKGLRERIAECDNKTMMQELIKEVATVKFDDINALLIKKDIAVAFKKVTDTNVTVSQVEKMIKKSRPFEKRKGDFADDYVFLTATGEYMARDNKTLMGPRAFDVAMGRETPLDGEGNETPATAYVRDKIEVAHMGMYAPHIYKTGSDLFPYQNVMYFNTYMPTNLGRVKQGTTDIVQRVKCHVAHILTDVWEQSIFIDYLAHNVQNPGDKKQWAILIQGVEGDGKSFFAEMMKWVMGHQNSKSVGAESLEEKFTPWAEGSGLVFVEEIKLDNIKKHEVLNKMKPYITNPVVSVRRMRTDVYEAINTTNYIIFTNFQDALPINDNDRRYAIMFSQWQDRKQLEKWMIENENYYANLYKDMRANAGEILDWLMTHKISDEFKNMSRAPLTEAKSRMVDMSRSDAAMLVEDAIATYECWDINNDVVNITKLTKLATDCFAEDQQAAKEFPKTSRLRNVMLELGYHSIGRYKDKDRRNQAIYAKDTTAKPIDFAQEDEDFVPF
jgi:hypothetical protein